MADWANVLFVDETRNSLRGNDAEPECTVREANYSMKTVWLKLNPLVVALS